MLKFSRIATSLAGTFLVTSALAQGTSLQPAPSPIPPIPVQQLELPPLPPAISSGTAPRTLPSPPPPPIPAPLPIPGSTEASSASAKKGAFMSRERIASDRARCNVQMRTTSFVIPAGEDKLRVQIPGAKGCLTAALSSSPWLEVSIRDGAIELISTSTPEADRRGEVILVAPNQTFDLTVTQKAL